jgi:tetratricopeptide (TPR) repeat protein
MLLAMGKPDAALDAFQAALSIVNRLVAVDASNVGWQRDLSISYGLIGDVQMSQGKFDDALKSYRDEFDVKDRLLKAAPDNIGRQRDIAVAYSHLGDAYNKQGDNKHAIDNYRLALAIMEGLASIDPKNQHWLAVLVEYNYDLAINGDDRLGALHMLRPHYKSYKRYGSSLRSKPAGSLVRNKASSPRRNLASGRLWRRGWSAGSGLRTAWSATKAARSSARRFMRLRPTGQALHCRRGASLLDPWCTTRPRSSTIAWFVMPKMGERPFLPRYFGYDMVMSVRVKRSF